MIYLRLAPVGGFQMHSAPTYGRLICESEADINEFYLCLAGITKPVVFLSGTNDAAKIAFGL